MRLRSGESAVSRLVGMADSLIWYAAYGSNLLEERFVAYLRGGEVPCSIQPQRGARNPADPIANRPFELSRALLFGRSSPRWNGGGVCFIGAADSGRSLGRAWLLTTEQFEDVWAQENGESTASPFDFELFVSQGSVRAERGWYRSVEHLGVLDGYPVATFTSADEPQLNAADEAYLLVVGRGLMETWGISAQAAASYLATSTGNKGHVDATVLSDELLTWL